MASLLIALPPGGEGERNRPIFAFCHKLEAVKNSKRVMYVYFSSAFSPRYRTGVGARLRIGSDQRTTTAIGRSRRARFLARVLQGVVAHPFSEVR